MMQYIRSAIFNVLFYVWSALCFISYIPLLFMDPSVLGRIHRGWVRGLVFLCRHVIGLDFRVEGNVPAYPVIIASKHQSAWETFIFSYLFPNPSIVLKEQLMWIPLLGSHLKHLGMIPISRSKNKGTQDLKRMLAAADKVVSQGRSILIFPEGTRSQVGEEGTYQEGVSSIYRHLNIPVAPVAHNAGVFWSRKSFLKHPGTITISFLPEIPPGLPRREFMATLKDQIETKTNALVGEVHGSATK